MRLKFWKRNKPKSKTEKNLEDINPELTILADKSTSTMSKHLHAPSKTVDKKIFTSKNLVMVTTEADLFLTPCVVKDDHRIKYKQNRKWREVKILKPPHILTIPLRSILPSFLNRRLSGKWARYRVYTVQAEGEVTHDPHRDEIDPELKKKFEAVLKLEGVMAKADFAKQITTGMNRQKKWEEFIPWLVVGAIVMMFLFAFQIAPNL